MVSMAWLNVTDRCLEKLRGKIEWKPNENLKYMNLHLICLYRPLFYL